MGTCNRVTRVFVLCLFATPIANSAGNATDPLAREYGIDENRPAQRTFANPEGEKNAWREYRSEKDAPEIRTFGQFAQVWTGPDGTAFIRMDEPSEDWASYTEYCFNKIGQLMALRFEVSTAWGWGYREDGRILKGILRPQRAEFFNTDSKVSMAKPEGAVGIADALKPFDAAPKVARGIRTA